MKKTTLNVYTAPRVEVCSAIVEAGYSASMPGVTINPWEREDDTLEF
jgi:hypothetical protein